MWTRRAAIAATASALVAPCEVLAQQKSPVLPTSNSTAQPVLSVTEQLMYSTVRLSTQILTKTQITTHWGTGFIFNLFNMNGRAAAVIVTNRHVIENWKTCSFKLAASTPDYGPDINKQIQIEIPNFQSVFIPHSQVDLAIIPISAAINNLLDRGTRPYTISLDRDLIPTDEELKGLLPVEQILTVGYPGLLWDDVHNLPVFHRGYTATAPYIDFKGNKEFLIDIATWPGASGSPVLLYNEGAWLQRNGTPMVGSRAKLIGIVYGVATQGVEGQLAIQNGPTAISIPSQMAVPTNLGACISASRVLDFEPILVSKGFKLPDGYVMRAK